MTQAHLTLVGGLAGWGGKHGGGWNFQLLYNTRSLFQEGCEEKAEGTCVEPHLVQEQFPIPGRGEVCGRTICNPTGHLISPGKVVGNFPCCFFKSMKSNTV
jgi:hypothetical protein